MSQGTDLKKEEKRTISYPRLSVRIEGSAKKDGSRATIGAPFAWSPPVASDATPFKGSWGFGEKAPVSYRPTPEGTIETVVSGVRVTFADADTVKALANVNPETVEGFGAAMVKAAGSGGRVTIGPLLKS